MAIISTIDLVDIPVDKRRALVDEVLDRASLVAPCIVNEGSLSEQQVKQFRVILIGAANRWDAVGVLPVTSETKTADIFTHTIRREGSPVLRGEFTLSEAANLRAICAGEAAGGAVVPRYSMPPVPASPWRPA